jgi:uncharacterized protein (TIGR03792 family)
MIIEWLKFKVFAQDQEFFLIKDAEIWTHNLRQYPGFLGKEIWLNPNHPDEMILLIRWQTLEQWKAIPQEVLEEIERQFHQAMGSHFYQMIESFFYQIQA